MEKLQILDRKVCAFLPMLFFLFFSLFAQSFFCECAFGLIGRQWCIGWMCILVLLFRGQLLIALVCVCVRMCVCAYACVVVCVACRDGKQVKELMKALEDAERARMELEDEYARVRAELLQELALVKAERDAFREKCEVFICMYMYIHRYVYICMYVCMYTYIYMYISV